MISNNSNNKIIAAIETTSNAIDKNIEVLSGVNNGLLSQNILSYSRNLVEYIIMLIFSGGKEIDPNDYELRKQAINYIKGKGNLKFLRSFHSLLQISASHYTLDEDTSDRLMIKYYEYLLRLKKFVLTNYNITILENLKLYPLNDYDELKIYHERIAEKILKPSISVSAADYNERYYIQKIVPFFVNEDIFYEITFSPANNNASKFDRVIAFSRCEINDNYAVRLSIHDDSIDILNKKITIHIIDNWQVSIRPCEFDNLSRIFGYKYKISGNNDYVELMNYLTDAGETLVDIIRYDNKSYDTFINQMYANKHVRNHRIIDFIDECRNFINRDSRGKNIVLYLLYIMNNKIIKNQTSLSSCEILSNLFLDYGCIPFDDMPYCSSLKQHNPSIFDLFSCIEVVNHDYELIARRIKNNTERENILFTPLSEFEKVNELDNLINKYNSKLYIKHLGRRIETFNNHLYIKSYADDTAFIIRELQLQSSSGILHYKESVEKWLKDTSYYIDDNLKREAIINLFVNSKVSFIYGSAGTGKSTFIKYVSDYFYNNKIIYLANTNPAVDNLRCKIGKSADKSMTIKKFLSPNNANTSCDLLVIDECSTVSNKDMRNILEKADYKLLLLVGDTYQIESILFGNWFSLAKSFLPENSIFELAYPFRTSNQSLLHTWDCVRKVSDNVLESIEKHGFSSNLDETIFRRDTDDEIILCLNYDGLYGVNNINRFLQNNNPNRTFHWGLNTYKINDPILFNETERFSPVIYNNMKGWIRDIQIYEDRIWFTIELDDRLLTEIDAFGLDFNVVGLSEKSNSLIAFSVNKFRSTDEDDDPLDVIVPFQIAYAVSIHKAQGLEYDSVKVIITKEIEEKITHNIFYTAITRAKTRLKIYWSPEVENNIIDEFKSRKNNKDAIFIKQKYNL